MFENFPENINVAGDQAILSIIDNNVFLNDSIFSYDIFRVSVDDNGSISKRLHSHGVQAKLFEHMGYNIHNYKYKFLTQGINNSYKDT